MKQPPQTTSGKTSRLLPVITLLIGILLGICIMLFFNLLRKSPESSMETTASVSTSMEFATTESTTTITTTRTTTSTTSTTTQATTTTIITTTTRSADGVELETLLQEEGFSPSELDNSQQLITVVSSGSSAIVSGYSRTEDGSDWSKIFTTNGCVGRNGVSAESQEGDYRTPRGLFSLGFAFGTENLTDLSIPYRQLNENCYWVDDPESPYYNQWQETTDISWNSAEHLISYASSYQYTVVINYNMDPIVPYAGSAIFLHCAMNSSTAGCVAVPTDTMREILYWLEEDAQPMILIV